MNVILDKLKLFFTLDKEDYLYVQSLGYELPVRVLKKKTDKITYTPKGYPSEYCWKENFTEYITLLLKDNGIITLTKRFGDDCNKVALSVKVEY